MNNTLTSETVKKNVYLNFLAIIFGSCIAAVFISFQFSSQKTDFEDAANFGSMTSTIMTSINGYRIHCGDSRDADHCIAGTKVRHAANSVVWLGNSQLHAVNQLKADQTNSTPLLFEKLKGHDLDLVTFSQPNANLQEHLVLFEYLKFQLPIKILILPVVFDDTREDGLRSEIAEFLSNSQVNMELKKIPIGLKIQKYKPSLLSNGNDMAGINNTMQEKVEHILNKWLDKNSDLWAARSEIRGHLMTNLFILRNTILGIKPSTKRKIIRGRYSDNLAALQAILSSASSSGIKVILYIAPLRNDVAVPYIDDEYLSFKQEVKMLANTYQASYFNLENLVPAELWGVKESTTGGTLNEIDYMHFQAGGHKLLAEHLAQAVIAIWSK